MGSLCRALEPTSAFRRQLLVPFLDPVLPGTSEQPIPGLKERESVVRADVRVRHPHFRDGRISLSYYAENLNRPTFRVVAIEFDEVVTAPNANLSIGPIKDEVLRQQLAYSAPVACLNSAPEIRLPVSSLSGVVVLHFLHWFGSWSLCRLSPWPTSYALSHPFGKRRIHLFGRRDREVMNPKPLGEGGRAEETLVGDVSRQVEITSQARLGDLHTGEDPIDTEADLAADGRVLKRTAGGNQAGKVPKHINGVLAFARKMIVKRGGVADMLLSCARESAAAFRAAPCTAPLKRRSRWTSVH